MAAMGKPRFEVVVKHSNSGLFLIISLAYCATLGLFGWQTWGFVSFLFPNDQLLMKLLTLFSFDVMALIWGCAHRFYRFAHPSAKTAVAWGWSITNLLSLAATVVYMVIQSMFRFHLTVGPDVVNFGYGVTIVALVFNIALLAAFLYNEIGIRFPNHDEFVVVDKLSPEPALPPPGITVPSLPPQQRSTRRFIGPPQQRSVQPLWNDENNEDEDEEEQQINVVSSPQRASAQPLQRTAPTQAARPLRQSQTFTPVQAYQTQKMSHQPVERLDEGAISDFQPALPINLYQVNSSRQGSDNGHQPGLEESLSVNMPPQEQVPSLQRIPASQPLPPQQTAATPNVVQPVIQEMPSTTHTPISERFMFPMDNN